MEIILPKTLEVIGDRTFWRCTNARNQLVLPDTLITIGDYAFSGCGAINGDLLIPNSVKTIGEQAFYNYGPYNDNITITLTLGNSLESILAAITIPIKAPIPNIASWIITFICF